VADPMAALRKHDWPFRVGKRQLATGTSTVRNAVLSGLRHRLGAPVFWRYRDIWILLARGTG